MTAPLLAQPKSLRLDDVREGGKAMGGSIGPHPETWELRPLSR